MLRGIVCLFLLSIPCQLLAQSSSVLAPSYYANFRIASGKVDGEKIEIVNSAIHLTTRKVGAEEPKGFVGVVKTKPIDVKVDKNGNAYVQQQYTVRIPYTEVVKDASGKMVPVSKIRMESRSRTVSMSGLTGKKVVSYDLKVPYTSVRYNAKGKPYYEHATRTEERLKAIEKDEELIRCKMSSKKTHKLDAVKCYSISGKVLDPSEVRKRLVEGRPIILLAEDKPEFDPYYAELLNSKTIQVYIKPEKE